MNLPDRPLSVSSINTWSEAPRYWFAHYILDYKTPVNSNMLRGTHVEGTINQWHAEGGDVLDHVSDNWYKFIEECEANQCEPTITREQFEAWVANSAQVIPQIGELHKTQVKLDFAIESVPFVGYIDYVYADGQLSDLKTTGRIPRSIRSVKNDHLRQLSVYQKHLGHDADAHLAYVSGAAKNYSELWSYSDPEYKVYFDQAYVGLVDDLTRLLKFCDKVSDVDEALSILPDNSESFRYNATDLNQWLEGVL